MSINECPFCGDGLYVWCQVFVKYRVTDDLQGGQDWHREEVGDDPSVATTVECDRCGRCWGDGEFILDRDGYISELIGDGIDEDNN